MSLAYQRPRTNTPPLTVNKICGRVIFEINSEATWNCANRTVCLICTAPSRSVVYSACLSGRSHLSRGERSAPLGCLGLTSVRWPAGYTSVTVKSRVTRASIVRTHRIVNAGQLVVPAKNGRLTWWTKQTVQIVIRHTQQVCLAVAHTKQQQQQNHHHHHYYHYQTNLMKKIIQCIDRGK